MMLRSDARIIPLNEIRLDGETQARIAINTETVNRYAEAYNRAAPIPPLICYFDGASLWLADGFHRYWALKQVGSSGCQVDRRLGTLDDARWFAVSVNGDHGLPRTDNDMAKCIAMAIDTIPGKALLAEKGKGGQKQLAVHIGCSEGYLSKELGKLFPRKDSDNPSESLECGAAEIAVIEFTPAEQKVVEYQLQNPNATAREVAEATALSQRTVFCARAKKGDKHKSGRPRKEPTKAKVEPTLPTATSPEAPPVEPKLATLPVTPKVTVVEPPPMTRNQRDVLAPLTACISAMKGDERRNMIWYARRELNRLEQ